MDRRRWLWLLLVGVIGVGEELAPLFVTLPFTVSEGYEPSDSPRNFPATKVVKDDRPAFQISPEEPWRIEFGRGSGWHGLDTVKLDQDGRAVFHRLKSMRQGDAFVLSWETATAQFPPDAVADVLSGVEANRLLGMDKAYHADIYDGTQWVLWIRQGDREKVVYCSNHFPDPIVRFAAWLDANVARSVGPSLKWRAVPALRSRDHERELWQSIER